MIVNPENTKEGFAFTLVGCPIADYAKKYGYEELMPHMCALDHTYAKLMHAKLIRTHTVATGADSCDYWYVPDFPSPSYFIQVFRKYKGLLRENIWKDYNYTGIRLAGHGNQAASKVPVSFGDHSRAKSAGSADP